MRNLPIRVLGAAASSLFLLLGAGACSDDKLAGGSTDGPKIFQDACARCHGAKGIPTAGMKARAGVKPLNSERAVGMSDEQLLEQIRNGSKNRMMPSFQGALSDAQLKALVAHIRDLQKASPEL